MDAYTITLAPDGAVVFGGVGDDLEGDVNLFR